MTKFTASASETGAGSGREGERELVDFINYSIYTSYIFRMPLALDTQRRAFCVGEGEGLKGQCGVIFVSLISAGVGQFVLAYCP